METANARRLNLLPEPSHTYVANDTSGTDIRGNPMPRQQAEQLVDRLMAVKELTLKVRRSRTSLTQSVFTIQSRLVRK